MVDEHLLRHLGVWVRVAQLLGVRPHKPYQDGKDHDEHASDDRQAAGGSWNISGSLSGVETFFAAGTEARAVAVPVAARAVAKASLWLQTLLVPGR